MATGSVRGANQQRSYHTRGTLDADRQHRLQDLPGWTWNPGADQWEEGFRRLQDYVKRHGDARVPHSYTVDGYKLGAWVNKQRDTYAKGTLDADRQRRLQDLPGWTWDPQADKWEEGFGRLLDYVERHGDARVPSPTSSTTATSSARGFRQRQGHAKGTLDADRERRLQDVPGWTWDLRADKWEEGFRRLLDYVERKGDARVPESYTIDGYKLGVWVDSQRSRNSKGTLEADRQRRLQDLPGWIWDPQADKSEEGFRRLLDYVERNGDARVPYSCKIDGYPLGQWVVAQRSHYARGRLGADRQRRLQDLPGWTWDPYADKWEEGFERLLDYVERHGDARVAKSYIVDGYPLGAWSVRNVRGTPTASSILTADAASRT